MLFSSEPSVQPAPALRSQSAGPGRSAAAAARPPLTAQSGPSTTVPSADAVLLAAAQSTKD